MRLLVSSYDPMFGPSQFARFRGGGRVEGHGDYDPQADEIGRDFLEEVLVEEYLAFGLPEEDSLRLAHERSDEIMQKRIEFNHFSYDNHELPRVPETVVTYVLRTDPRDGKEKLWEQNNEIFLEQMLVNTERYAKESKQPWIYNADEAEAIRGIEHALISGDAEAGVYPVWHESRSVRYFAKLSMSDDGSIEARYVDVGKEAGDLTPKEAMRVMQYLTRTGVHEEDVSIQQHDTYPAFHSSLDTVDTTVIRNIATAIVLTRIDPPASQDMLHEGFVQHGEHRSGFRESGDAHSVVVPRQQHIGTLRAAELLHNIVRTEDVNTPSRSRRFDKFEDTSGQKKQLKQTPNARFRVHTSETNTTRVHKKPELLDSHERSRKHELQIEDLDQDEHTEHAEEHSHIRVLDRILTFLQGARESLHEEDGVSDEDRRIVEMLSVLIVFLGASEGEEVLLQDEGDEHVLEEGKNTKKYQKDDEKKEKPVFFEFKKWLAAIIPEKRGNNNDTKQAQERAETGEDTQTQESVDADVAHMSIEAQDMDEELVEYAQTLLQFVFEMLAEHEISVAESGEGVTNDEQPTVETAVDDERSIQHAVLTLSVLLMAAEQSVDDMDREDAMVEGSDTDHSAEDIEQLARIYELFQRSETEGDESQIELVRIVVGVMILLPQLFENSDATETNQLKRTISEMQRSDLLHWYTNPEKMVLLYALIIEVCMAVSAISEKRQDDRNGEVDVHEVSDVWVLLSIIWYLSLLREGGVVQTTQASDDASDDTALGDDNTTQPVSYGIIFAFQEV